MIRRASSQRRSFVLIAVLVIVGSALLVATSLLFKAQAEAAGAALAADAAQSRALAWSGLQAVMGQLNDQRQRILQGELPRLDRQYTMYETPLRIGVIRVLPMSAGDGGAAAEGEQRFSCEAGKIDLNSAAAAALARTGMIDAAAASAIVAYRDHTLHRPLQSATELLNVPGGVISPEALYGPIEKITPRDDAQFSGGDLQQRVAARLDIQPVRGLSDALTVFSVEPSLQFSGTRRINLNRKWSDDLADAVLKRFDQNAADQLKQLFDRGAKFDSEAKIFQALRQLKIQPDDWPQIIDTFATDDDIYHFGRLDINTAPYEVLLALPGVTAEQAAQLVRVRSELSPEERATIAWPAIAQIIPPEQYDQLAGRITTRCWTYRVRLAAGEIDAEDPEGPLDNPLIYEAVIDLSAPQPRIAYLRDISMLQVTAQTAASASLNQPPQTDRPGEESAGSDQPEPQATAADGPGAAAAPAEEPTPPPPPPATRQPRRPQPAAQPADQGDFNPSAARRKIGRWLAGQ